MSHSENSKFSPQSHPCIHRSETLTLSKTKLTKNTHACGSESILSCQSHLPTITDMDHPMGASISEMDCVPARVDSWWNGQMDYLHQADTNIFLYNDWGKSNFWLCSVRCQYFDEIWKDMNVKSWWCMSGTKMPLSSGSPCVSSTISCAGMRYRIVKGI